jgi:hypothetical protein
MSQTPIAVTLSRDEFALVLACVARWRVVLTDRTTCKDVRAELDKVRRIERRLRAKEAK